MRVRRNEFCPIHQSVSCRGRERVSKPRLIRLVVQGIEDPHHSRGYRELRSPAEMRKLLNRKIVEQAGNAQSVMSSSRTTATWCRTLRIRRKWAARGETIRRTISR